MSLYKTNERPGLSSFALHLLAMGFMLCDHLWGTLLPQFDLLTRIGRLSLPIFMFLLVEGFSHTSSRKRYALRLLIFAVVSELPFNLMTEGRLFYPLHQNVLWTMLLTLGMLCLLERISAHSSLILRVLLYALTVLAAYILGFLFCVDYFGYGPAIAALFYFTRRIHVRGIKRLPLMLIQAAVLYWICDELIKGIVITLPLFGLSLDIHAQTLAVLSLPLIWLYNGQRGLHTKAVQYSYYAFYPLHMLILGLAALYG